MPGPPREASPDSTLAWLRDPYRFIARRCAEHGADAFQARLAGNRVVCLTGPEAAEFFYDERRVVRAGAAPRRLRRSLFGEHGVQGLDGEPHRSRKELFTCLLTEDRVRDLGTYFAGALRADLGRWAAADSIRLYGALQPVLTRATCAWAGVPLGNRELARRSRELVALFDGTGAVGPRHWRARMARASTRRWMARVVADIRTGRLNPGAGSPASAVAWHREADGTLLSQHAAATELLNILRPTVAVAVYLTFVAHALHRNPEWARTLAGEDARAEEFVQEVRRYYPFFPAVLGVAREDLVYQGVEIPAGRRVVLDLYGTNHDPRAWHDPETFDPQRFVSRSPCPYAFVPQGGAHARTQHRCPGEPVAVELMKIGARMLTRDIDYDVPDQDLTLDYTRLPALPHSRMLLTHVRPRA